MTNSKDTEEDDGEEEQIPAERIEEEEYRSLTDFGGE